MRRRLLILIVLLGASGASQAAEPAWVTPSVRELESRGDWWRVFKDPQLDQLETQAAEGSTRIHMAAARLARAKAQRRAAGADRLPRASLGTGATRQGGPLINAAGGEGTLYNIGADLDYEIDLFGRVASAARAARLETSASVALLENAKLLVQADVASTYFSLRAADAERLLVQRSVASLRDGLLLVQRRHADGYVSDLDVARARAELAEAEAEDYALARRRSELESTLAVLTGQEPSALQIPATDWSDAVPGVPGDVGSELLLRRPDVSAAVRSLQAAQQRTRAARLAGFPRLSLTAGGGFASAELAGLFATPALFWRLGAAVTQPLFDGGRRRAQVESARADEDEAAAQYRERTLLAFKDVRDQLEALRFLSMQAEHAAEAVAAGTQALSLSTSRYRSGLANQLDLLDAQRAELRERRAALSVQTARFHATVGLIRALGGGWQEREPD